MMDAHNTTKSLMQRKHDAIEIVSKKILNKFGYPNDIEIFSKSFNNDIDFVLMGNATVIAKITCSNFNVNIWLSHYLE